MKLYPFSALLARMKYITRWSLMHSTRPESLSEHTCDTALMAHILCLIAVKYSSPGLRDAYKALEAESVDAMTRLLPPELAEEVSPFITGSLLTAEEKRLLKAADRLSALVKCMEEQRSGNHEFDAALRQQRKALEEMHCPEADWFMAHCLPCFTQNLDELTRSE